MALIVIEGDNGTGKDTLAKKLAGYGYDIISYFPDVKKCEKYARNDIDKTQSFLEYNNYCGNLSRNTKTSSIIIRYWISTLAAAYADYIYEYDKVMKLTDEMKKNMVAPNIVIRIWVDTKTRLDRIALRGVEYPKLSDNISINRAQRYEWISKEILYRSGYCWREYDNTSSNIENLVSEVLEFIKEVELNE